MNIELKPGERLDDLQRNGYKIIQDPGRFCFGMDAVLLSGFAKVKPGERVVDLGTGTGIIPILLEARSKGASFTGLEIQPESADMASRSVQLNDLQERVHIVNGDIKEAVQIFGAASCHVVTSNPPYMTAQHGLQNPDQPKAIARHEVLCTLEDVISQAAGLLMPGGRFYMVHRPFRLAEIMTGLCAHGLEPKRMQLVYPYVDRAGKRCGVAQCARGAHCRGRGAEGVFRHTWFAHKGHQCVCRVHIPKWGRNVAWVLGRSVRIGMYVAWAWHMLARRQFQPIMENYENTLQNQK